VTTESPLASSDLRPALEILDTQPVLPEAHLNLLEWASRYYHHPLGEVIAACLPGLLRQGRNAALGKQSVPLATPSPEPPLDLNHEQTQAVGAVCAALGGFTPFLLEGVTGSGKTEVYLRVIEEVVKRGRQALILVPEIGLTAQTITRFQARFTEPLAVFHSGLTDRERLNAWLSARDGLAPIVIGTRSAVWTPLKNPGVIIVDEEHDLSYKQQDGFRYSARDVAVMRAQREAIPLILGSATPSLESIHNVDLRRYQHLKLPQRTGIAGDPHIQLLDLRGAALQDGLADPLIRLIATRIERKEQVLLFLNRRGYAPILLCHQCGWTAGCARCDARLTYHQAADLLRCHHCGAECPSESTCPECGSRELLRMGSGTERVAESITRLFPNAHMLRIDRDTTRRKGSLEKMFSSILSGEADILVGTQMLSKGHHFPKVTLAAIIDADSRLHGVDFRAGERLSQLLIQVAGRAGRADEPGTVVIQTHCPEHPLLQTLIHQGYARFAQSTLAERKAAGLPPYHSLALLRAEAPSQAEPKHFLEEASEMAQSLKHQGLEVLGPVTAPMERRAGRYRWQLLLEAPQRQILQKLLAIWIPRLEGLKSARRVRWSIDVDPQEMI
jgi:primosomal protein N' (replication factor Y)